MIMKQLFEARLTDWPVAERVRQSVFEAIRELQALLEGRPRVVKKGVELPADGSTVTIAHKLGRKPEMVIVSPVRPLVAGTTPSPGVIVEHRGKTPTLNAIDSSQVIVLQALGFGATVIVDITVM